MIILLIYFHLRPFSVFVRIRTIAFAFTSANCSLVEVSGDLSTCYPQPAVRLDFPASYETLPARLLGSP